MMKCFGRRKQSYHCKVVLLDAQELIQEIQGSSLGQELLDVIFKHLNLIETAYFGLRFLDKHGQTYWLESSKKIVKQLKGSESLTLYFGVKFYAADPCKLVEEITRYQFFLQIKQDILQGRLPVAPGLSIELFAFSVQSELGDYDSRRHSPGYISEFRFIDNQQLELETCIAEGHRAMAGQSPAVAEFNYLEKVKWLDMYGVDLHPVLGEDNVDYFLGLTPSGIIVLRNKTKVGNYFWPRIDKITYKGKYFMIRARNKANEEQTYGFETPTKSACRHLWKCSVEHHAFFRLVQVAPGVNNKMASINSRFRESTSYDSSANQRTPPHFVRTLSKRYQRRIVEGAQDVSEVKEVPSYVRGIDKTVAIPQFVEKANIHHAPLAVNKCDSPKSVRSTLWEASNELKQASIKSSNSAQGSGRERSRNPDKIHRGKRSVSAESNSSRESRSHSRRRHHRYHDKCRRTSDNESEVSKSSARSHGKRRHRSGSSNHRESGSESESCNHRRRHRHRHSEKYEFVDSEVQWKQVQTLQSKSCTVPQNTAIRELGVGCADPAQHLSNSVDEVLSIPHKTPVLGRNNENFELQSPDLSSPYHQRRRHRRSSHRSKSPQERDKRLSSEVKRHLEFTLIETAGMSQEQLMQIPYTKVETSEARKSARHSVTLTAKTGNKSSYFPEQTPVHATVKGKVADCGDSPPPPYSATVLGEMSLSAPSLPMKRLVGNRPHGAPDSFFHQDKNAFTGDGPAVRCGIVDVNSSTPMPFPIHSNEDAKNLANSKEFNSRNDDRSFESWSAALSNPTRNSDSLLRNSARRQGMNTVDENHVWENINRASVENSFLKQQFQLGRPLSRTVHETSTEL